MNIESLINLPEQKKILILGFGTENKQFLDWLIGVAKFPINRVVLADKNQPVDLEFQIPVENQFFGENYLDSLSDPNIQYVFKAPGVWSLMPQLVDFRARNGNDSVNSGLVFFFQKFRQQIVAITGTKGKSTTSSLTNHFLNYITKDIKSFYCGNTTGISPYNYWTEFDQVVDKNTFFVVETSSFQLQDLGFAGISAKYAVITNYYIDHLDQHGNSAEYWNSKDNIFKFQQIGDQTVIRDQVLSVSPNADYLREKAFIVDTRIAEKISSDLSSNLLGEHNKFNLAEAVIIASLVTDNLASKGTVLDQIDKNKSIYSSVLDSFKPLSHRIELVRTENVNFKFKDQYLKLKINFYDDGYATEPDAVIAAIKSLSSQPNELLWLQLAGKDKGGNLDHLAVSILEVQLKDQLYRVDYCGEVGRNILIHIYTQLGIEQELEIEKFRDAIQDEFVSLQELSVNTEKYVAEKLNNYIDLGADDKVEEFLGHSEIVLNVLFSPSGSSFDEFKNVTDRADWWVEQVRRIK